MRRRTDARRQIEFCWRNVRWRGPICGGAPIEISHWLGERKKKERKKRRKRKKSKKRKKRKRMLGSDVVVDIHSRCG